MQPNIDRILTLAEQVSGPLGLSVVDARLSQQGKHRSLEITIYKPGGRIGLDDCESVSRQLEELIETQSPPVIDGSFLLEVQSPGIERKLKTEREFKIFAGQKVEVKAKESIQPFGATFAGTLVKLDSGVLVIGQPQTTTPQSKSKKKAAAQKAEVEIPEIVELAIERVAEVRLLPEEVKDDNVIDIASLEG